MNAVKRWRIPLEVVAAKLGLGVLPRLPRGMIILLARSFGRAGWTLSGRDRSVAMANLSLAFPERPPQWLRHTAIRSFENFALTLLDIAWFSQRMQERLDQWIEIDPSASISTLPRQTIGLVCHYGNWELISRAMLRHGMPLAAVAAPLANPAVEQLFLRLRSDAKLDVIPKKGALRGILKAVRNGCSVAFVMDQNVLPADGGVFVPFFGLPALFSSAPAGIMLKTGIPAVTVFCNADRNGHYNIRASPPFRAQPDADRIALTQQIAGYFQQTISDHPEPWLWMYKRWKYIPDGYERAKFPFYARTPAIQPLAAGSQVNHQSPGQP